jgi:hypothetical protein
MIRYRFMRDGCRDDDLLRGADTSAEARALAMRGFAALWHGHQPRVVDLGIDNGVIRAHVRAGRLEVDEAGRLVGVHGLVARPTAHRIEHAHGVVHTWCAFDAIGLLPRSQSAAARPAATNSASN